MIDQISVFTENKRGTAHTVFSILAKEKINLLSLMNSDSGEFGTMRMIVSEPAKAFDALKEAGYLCKADRVMAVELEDQPGALDGLLSHIGNMNINIRYMYVGYMRENSVPVILIHCDEMDIVEKSLIRNGYTLH